MRAAQAGIAKAHENCQRIVEHLIWHQGCLCTPNQEFNDSADRHKTVLTFHAEIPRRQGAHTAAGMTEACHLSAARNDICARHGILVTLMAHTHASDHCAA